MKRRRAFVFRLRPTKKQRRILQGHLDECRWLYNQFLEQRKLSWEELDQSLTKYHQQQFLPLMKKERPSLLSVHSQVLQNVGDRLDKAMKAFFRRVKSNEKAGFPRFRGIHRYDSFCYPQSGFTVEGKHIKLSKIGKIRLSLHRPISGKIKTCTIKRLPSDEWEVSLSCEVEIKPLPKAEVGSVGIDLGIENFAFLSDGSKIDNPRFFRSSEKKLAKAQRALSQEKKGTKKRSICGKRCAKIHRKIANQRKDFCHKESRKIVSKYQNICIEDLKVERMIKGSHYAKSITDVSWSQFRQYLAYKAEEAGRRLGIVNPAYTTQKCNNCGEIEKKQISQRAHCCKNCGYTTHRDHNASQNILALGLDGLGVSPRSLRL